MTGETRDSARVHQLLSRLRAVRQVRGGWMAGCPAHEDDNPSLSITERDGRILLKCFAGCAAESIVSALGLRLSDLFADGKPSGNATPEAVYPYTDESGRLLFEVVRFPGKQFRQRRPDSRGGWIYETQ
jgi:hypothetical protein